MKKIIFTLLIMFALFSFVGVVNAEDVAKPKSVFSEMSLSGDLLCVISENGCIPAGGVGWNFATFADGIVELRAEAIIIVGADGGNLYGVGAGVNIAKVVEKIKGEWKIPEIVPTVGVMALIDMQKLDNPKYAVYLSIVKLKF